MSLKNFPKPMKQITELDSNSGCLAPTAVISKIFGTASISTNLFGLIHSFCSLHILTSACARVSKPHLDAFGTASKYRFKNLYLQFIPVYGRPAGKKWQMSYSFPLRAAQWRRIWRRWWARGYWWSCSVSVSSGPKPSSCYHRRVTLKHAVFQRAFCLQTTYQSQKN